MIRILNPSGQILGNRRFLIIAAWAVLAVLFLSDAAWACPGCNQAIANQKGGGNLVAGFQYSILFMMAMPFTLLGAFCGYMYLEVRRAQARQAAEIAAHAAPSSQTLSPDGQAVEVRSPG